MPAKRKQNLAETDRRSYYKEEWKKNFKTVKVNFVMITKVIMMKITNNNSYWKVLPIVATK